MKKYLFISLSVVIFFMTKTGFAQSVVSNQSTTNDKDAAIEKMLEHYDKLIYFTENKGQWPVNVLYKADFPLGQAIATKEGMMVGTFDPASIAARSKDMMQEEKAKKKGLPYRLSKTSIKGHGWLMNFVNSSPAMSIETTGKHAEFYNYLTGGDDSKNAMNAGNYQEIWYKNVYDNVDVRYYPSKTGTLEYDIVCKPGFDKKKIELKFDGIDKISLKENGHLLLNTSVGEMEYPAPVAYQQIDGKRKSIEAKYKLTDNNEFTFVLGKYDASRPLIIDPIALRWATWITNNSTGNNHAHCVWVDPTDTAIYIACRIQGSGLITVNAFDNTANGSTDVVLGKYKQPAAVGGAGSRIWQTYLGGGADDNPLAMEQGPDGNLYVTGWSGSSNFPLSGGSGGAFNGEPAGINDRSQGTAGNNPLDNIFIVKFNQAGTSFKSAVIGGNGTDQPFDLRITPHGDILVCGFTNSTNLGTVVGQGAINNTNNDYDVFVLKIRNTLDSIYWFKNYGGTGYDQANIMLADPTSGNLFIAGETQSADFPVTDNARQGTLTGSEDGFIQKLDSNGNIIWSSFFNAAANDSAQIGCMEFNTTHDKIYFGGTTSGLNESNIASTDTVSDSTYNGEADFFVALMDTSQTLLKATYLGGKGTEINMMGLNVDLNNDVYIFGYSNSANFPVTTDALQMTLNNGGTNGNNHDETFTKLRSDLDSVIYSTYYGGDEDDYDPQGVRGIKFSNCRIYTLVTAISNNIPLTYGAITTDKKSDASQATGIYEPGLLVWANPPDLTSNTISGSQRVCYGVPPSNLTGSLPSYSLPTITRNGDTTAYPVNYNSVIDFQWEYSTDSIHWHDIPGGNTQNLAGSLIPITADTTYVIRIINGDACIGVDVSDQIISLVKFAVPGTVTNVTCFGLNNGSITVNPVNGTAPYQYSWNTGATTSSIANLSPGTYKVVVQDETGCTTDTTSFKVSQPLAPLSATPSSVTDTCGRNHGSAGVTPSGGTAPYYYLWNTGQTTSSISGLSANTYTVTVTDSNKCSFVTEATVGNISGPNVSILPNPPSSVCQGDSIQLCASGADTYSWSTGQTTSCIYVGANLAGGSAYGFSVIGTVNATHCTGGAETSVTVNSPPTVGITPSGSVSFCQGDSAQLCVGGAVTYIWSPNGQTTSCIYVSANGTYSVSGTDGNGCTANASVGATVIVPIAPSVTDVDNCGSSTLSTTATGSLLWSTGATTSSINVTAAGTYTVTLTGGVDNCSSQGTGIAAPLIIPSAPSVNDIDNCGSSTLSTTATGNLLWSTGATTSSITVTTAGTYTVTQTAVDGCTSAPGSGDAAPSSIPSAPSVNDVDNCGSSTLSTTATGNLSWSTGATTSSITVTTAGTYTVTQTTGNCTSAPGSGNAAPLSVPSAPSVTDVDNCGSSTLSTTATGILLWSTGATTSSINVTTGGTYTVTQTAGDGCTSSPGSGNASPLIIPSAPSVNDVDNCGSSTLSTTATGNLLWSTGATTSSINVTTAGTYTVTQTIGTCTGAPGSGNAAPLSIPSAPSVTDVDNCGSSTLSTTATGNLLWSTGATTSSITVTAAGTYTVTQTAGDGCTSAPGSGDAAPLSIPSAPSVNDVDNCGSSTLSTTATGNLLWSTGATTSSITVTTAGTYTVTQTIGTCTSAPGSGNAAPSSIPSTPSVNDVDNCGSSTLSTTATGNLLWSTGATTSSITVTTAGTYTVTQATGACVSAPGSGNAAPLSVPSAPSVNDVDNCGSSTLSTTATGNLLWSTGATTSSITVTTAGSYSLTQTLNGCSATGTNTAAPVAIPSAPVVQVSNNCGNSVLYTTATGSLLWNTGATTSAITVSTAGTYSVTQTVSGCISANGTGTASPVSVSGVPPVVTVINNCNNTSMLYTTATGSLLWNTGATTSSITVSVAGTYSVTTSSNGCTSPAGTGIAAPKIAPNVSISCPATTCQSSSIQLCASGANSYVWNTGATTTCITISANGTYSVVGTTNGCTGTASVPVTFSQLPNCTITGKTSICASGCGSDMASSSTQLCAPDGDKSYHWSTGATTQCITVSQTGCYSVTVTNNGGCSSTCSATVTASTPPSCNISGPSSICEGQTTSLCAPAGNASYLWSTGATTSCITINKAGTYSVTVTNSSGCFSTCSKCVVLGSAPSCSISTGCDGNMACNGSTSLCGPSNCDFNTTFSWNTGAITRCITVTQSGTYTLTVTSGSGCSSSCCQKVIVGTTPSCTISGNNSMCNGDSTDLCAPAGSGISYSWSTGATTQCIEVKYSGTYSVTVTNNTGCSSTCSKCVVVYNGGMGDTTAAACNSFTWYGTTYTSSTNRATHIFSNAGCDSTVTLNLTIYHSSSSSFSATACNTYSLPWDTTVTQSGQYCHNYSTVHGCDSTVCVNITINHSNSSSFSATACNTYSLPWDTTVTQSGQYCHNYSTVNGCDSTVCANITINHSSSSSFSTTACNTYSLSWDTTVTQSGQYCHNYSTVTGCDSTVCANITIHYSNTGDTTAVACNSFTWYGTIYTSSGTPTHLLVNAGGCDSTLTLNLIINYSPTVGINSSGKLNLLCVGDPLELCATGAATYVWNTGATTSCISVTAAGTYSVIGTNSSGCSATDTVTVIAQSPPTITIVTISGKSTFCQGDSVQLCAVGAAVYSWSPGGQATTCIYASATGTYSVIGTDTITGCSGSDTISVIENYSTSSLTTANGCNNYIWNGTTYTTGGSYSHNASPNAAGCDSIAYLNLTISLPDTSFASITACDSYLFHDITYTSSANLYLSGGLNVAGCDSVVNLNLTINHSDTSYTPAAACNSYIWNGTTYTGSGTYSYNASPNAARCDSIAYLNLTIRYSSTGDTTVEVCGSSYLWNGTTYTLSGSYSYAAGSNAAGCDSTAYLNLTLTTPPPVNITGPSTICQGGTLQLCATGADSYTWSTGETTSCITIDTLVALRSPYAFSVTGPNGSTCPGGAETGVTVNAPPTVGISPPGSLSFCQGDSVMLCASGAVSYIWSPGSQTSSCITVSAAGTYSVTGTDANTCTASASVGVIVNSSSTGDTTAIACNSFTWHSTTYTSSGTATYALTNAAGCDSTVTLNLTINLSDTSFISVTACDSYAFSNTTYTSSANLYFSAGLNAAGCDSTVNLNLTINHSDTSYTSVTACDSYTWNGSTYTTGGTYSYNASPNAVRCDSIAYLVLTINTHPEVTITGDTTLCEGSGAGVQLCVVSGISYVWSPDAGGATTQCINVFDPGKYVVNVTFEGGCTGSDSITVTISTPPNVTITPGGPTTICEGSSVQLCASGATNYLWNNGATTSCITATATGTYSVTGTGNSCSAGASIGVTVNNGTTSTTTLSECNSYIWNSTTYTISGSYSYNASPNAGGCDSTAYLNLTINHSTDTTYSATACSSYLLPWDSTVTQTGQYCHVYNNDNCGRTICINVTIGGGYANCTISGNTSICAAGCGGRSGNSTQLCAPEGNSAYLWNTGATTQCITVSHAGTYSVTVSNNSGCSSSCSATVTTSAPPSCEISGNSSICDGQSTKLCAPEGDGYSYLWSNGATTQCITVWKAGTYAVTVTNSGGCYSTCSKCVKVSSGPSCSISTGCGRNMNCEGATLCGPSNCEWNTTFLWSTGATTRCIDVTASGTYTLTVTNGSGCSSSCCKTVTVGTPPPCTITGNTYICQGECSSLCGPDGDGLSYLWSNGDRTQCIRVTCSGTYYLTVTNSSGCSSTCSVCVTVSEAPACCISGNLSIMRGQCTTLCATRGCESYLWNNGKTTECITVNCPGTYCVTITNKNGCSSTCSVCVVYDNGCGRQSSSPDGIPMNSFGNMDVSAYPNPFTSLATIEFQRTDVAAHVLIEVFALNGDKVATIFDGEVEAGVVYKAQFDAANLAEGVYMYRIISDDNVVNGKLLLVKN